MILQIIKFHLDKDTIYFGWIRQIYIQNCISNLMKILSLIVLLLSAVYSLRIGQLACCPQSYVYDEDTLTCVCPANKPYVTSNGQCVDCAAPKRWDAQTRICHRCRVDQKETTNGTCECTGDTHFDNGTKCEPCPDDLPIWNGYKCVACPTHTHYDVGSKTCTVCPQGLVYNAARRLCQIEA